MPTLPRSLHPEPGELPGPAPRPRQPRSRLAVAAALAAALLAGGLAGCGSGTGEASAGPVRVSISPGDPSMTAGALLGFVATVTGSSNKAVTWSVQEGSGGGAITSAGLYTAPAGAGTYHVVATSAADPTASATAAVTVTDASTCLGAALLGGLGRPERVMVGFSGEDAVASAVGWDLRYLYLAGVISTDQGSCSSANGAWWGCWQDWSQPPGKYVTDFVSAAAARGEIPMITYYTLLQASGASEGSGEVSAAAGASFMAKYLADWRFLLTRIGSATVFLHVEPDFWGYAQHVNADPAAIAAAVASADPTDCAGVPNTIAGLGQCMIAMARTYAPNARIGLHASAWSTGIDALLNDDGAVDVTAHAVRTAAFLAACGGGEADFTVVEASDRDAGYYQSMGRDTWWDASDASLPDFAQALSWYRALAEAAGKPLLWWQVPVGNTSLADETDAWRDNRVQYFFDHPDRFAAAHVVGAAFGAGMEGMTTPSTDGGYLEGRARTYLSAGGTPACP